MDKIMSQYPIELDYSTFLNIVLAELKMDVIEKTIRQWFFKMS